MMINRLFSKSKKISFNLNFGIRKTEQTNKQLLLVCGCFLLINEGLPGFWRGKKEHDHLFQGNKEYFWDKFEGPRDLHT